MKFVDRLNSINDSKVDDKRDVKDLLEDIQFYVGTAIKKHKSGDKNEVKRMLNTIVKEAKNIESAL